MSDRVERIYRAHPLVQDLVVFGDDRTPCVAFVVSEASERDLRIGLDELARRSPGCPRLVDFVALAPGDPLVAPLFPAAGPRRDLIWEILFGCFEFLTLIPAPRFTAVLPASRLHHSHQGVD